MKLFSTLQDQLLSHFPIRQYQSNSGRSILLQSIRDIHFSTIQLLFYRGNTRRQHNFPANCHLSIALRNWLSVPYSHSLSKRYFPTPCSSQDGIPLRQFANPPFYKNFSSSDIFFNS